MVNISIYFVDGSMSEYEENDLFILQLRKLQNNEHVN
jgi:hypothetical protein